MIGLLTVLLVGTSLVAKELERRTIYNLLSRPISRSSYLVGKWAGSVGRAVDGVGWCSDSRCGARSRCAACTGAARDPRSHLPRRARADGGDRDRGAVLLALDAGAVGALHARRSTWSGQWSYDLRELVVASSRRRSRP